jgi:hypothetical protein
MCRDAREKHKARLSQIGIERPPPCLHVPGQLQQQLARPPRPRSGPRHVQRLAGGGRPGSLGLIASRRAALQGKQHC